MTQYMCSSICYIQVRNEKARRFLSSMRKKPPQNLMAKFPMAEPAAVKLIERMLAFDPAHRPTAEEVSIS